MIIESINIKSFGMITDMTLNFAEDINVIVGHNEAGKSTIAAFIKYMLYGFGNDGSADAPDERTRRINWENGTAQGSMTVRTGEKRYMITRAKRFKDFFKINKIRQTSYIVMTLYGFSIFLS